MQESNNLYGFKSPAKIHHFLHSLPTAIGLLEERFFYVHGERLHRNGDPTQFPEIISYSHSTEKRSTTLSKRRVSQFKQTKRTSKRKRFNKKLIAKIITFIRMREFFRPLYFESMVKFQEPPLIAYRPPLPLLESPTSTLQTEITPPAPALQHSPRKIERSYPPLSLVDTCIFTKGSFRSAHGKGKWFYDDEIITIHDIVGQEEIPPSHITLHWKPIYAKKSENGKYVIQQQATRGCTAATAAMLIKDHGRNPDAFKLSRRNLGNTTNQMHDIRDAGLTPILTSVRPPKTLKSLLEQHGSAIVKLVDENLGAHVVVVDEITDNGVRLRDPYHGWEITVTPEAFNKRFNGGEAIQIETTLS